MLANLVEIQKRVLQPLADSGHATKRSALQLLALEERLGILEQAHVISGDGLNKMFCGGQLTEGNTEVVRIVECVQKILVEWMDVLQSWKSIKNQRDLLAESLLRELDLSCVKISDSTDLETSTNLRRQTSLGAAKHNV
jgi:hypothetical protein